MLNRSNFAADSQAAATLQADNPTAGSAIETVNASDLQLHASPYVIAVLSPASLSRRGEIASHR